MKKRFAYIFVLKPLLQRIQEAIPRHVNYWANTLTPWYTGGPFTDHAAGLICFEARDLDEANALIQDDPFLQEDLLETHWLKEWVPAYMRLDARLGWRIGEAGELSLVLQNLLDSGHPESHPEDFSVASEVTRSAYVRVRWQF